MTTSSAPRFGRLHKASAVVPLALLSTAWTASLVGVSSPVAAGNESTLPDGTVLPTEAIEAPATVARPGVVAPAIGADGAEGAIAGASANGIPAAALAAYQRAEAVINAADKTCELPWQLVAAIGRVESDHGRYGGNRLDDEGLATPGIYGIALNGKRGTQEIRDTDAGQYDNDTEYDRAVGPMQFIPSTWSVVGVDGDNDGKRNPQDIDDAALASAVYLCSGKDDLSGEEGQRASVFRYNHSEEYVDLVLAIMDAYLAGDFTSVPNSTTSAGYFSIDPASPYVAGTGERKVTKKSARKKAGGGTGSTGSTGSTGGDGGSTGSTGPITTPDTDTDTSTGGGDDGGILDPITENLPSLPGSGGGSGGGGGGGGTGGGDDGGSDPVQDTLTRAEATAQCTAQLDLVGLLILTPTQQAQLEQCITGLLNP